MLTQKCNTVFWHSQELCACAKHVTIIHSKIWEEFSNAQKNHPVNAACLMVKHVKRFSWVGSKKTRLRWVTGSRLGWFSWYLIGKSFIVTNCKKTNTVTARLSNANTAFTKKVELTIAMIKFSKIVILISTMKH